MLLTFLQSKAGWLILTCIIICCKSHADSLRTTLDWLHYDQLTSEQREQLPPGSCGAYVAPQRDDSEATLEPQDAPLRADAKKLEMLNAEPLAQQKGVKQKNIALQGNVTAVQGYRQLKAERMEINEQAGRITMQQAVEIREPNMLILGNEGVYDQKADEVTVEGAIFVNHHKGIRGSAARFKRTQDNQLILNDADFTHCEPGNSGWLLEGSRIRLDQQAQQGHIYNARLLAGGLPVFYTPYLRFPLGDARMSGFLYPSIAFEEENQHITVPYYFNLAPHYDWLLTAHWLERHGVLYDNLFRHLGQYFSSKLTLAQLFNDRGALERDDQALVDNNVITPEQAAPFKGQDRWLVHLAQQGKGSGWTSTIDYAKVSDIDYFRDFDFSPIADRDDTYLNQKINLQSKYSDWNVRVAATRYQTLSDSITVPYEQLPALTANRLLTWGDWSLGLNHEWIDFQHPDDNSGSPGRLVGNRLRLDYRLGWDYERQWGFIRPAVQLKHLNYRLSHDDFAGDNTSEPSLTVPQFTLTTGLLFDRYSDRYLQTFEPKMFYFYSGYRDHSALFDLTADGQDVDFDTANLSFSYSQIFRDTRFSGGDRIDDANQLGVGLSTRFYGNESGREWFSAGAGQIHYFDDRRVTLSNTPETANKSDIIVQFGSNPIEGLDFGADLQFDDIENRIKEWRFTSRYQSSRKHFWEWSYRYTRGTSNDLRESNLALIAPLKDDRWHLFLYNSRDMENDRELESISAIEYNGCCVRVRFGYRSALDNRLLGVVSADDLDYDYSTFIELHFKGLGSSSKSLDTLLDENISGYAQWQAVYHQK